MICGAEHDDDDDDGESNDCEMIAAAAMPENSSSDPLAVDWCSNDGPAAATFRNNDDDYDGEQEESARLIAMSGDVTAAGSGAVIKCIAFYPYTVCSLPLPLPCTAFNAP